MLQFEDIPVWETKPADILGKIAAEPSVLKILLKTKNDTVLLERWLAHHLRMVGPNNVIVFDNMSDDPKVLAAYERHKTAIQLVRFAGFHNRVHDVETFRGLYDSLAQSAEYFVFLDTDEFLVLLDHEDHYINDRRLLDFLIDRKSENLFPGTWLYNTNWTFHQFSTSADALVSGLAWGKPILRSKGDLRGFINHNIQLDSDLLRAARASNIFVLHMANLSPQQRIHSNMNKLLARRFINAEENAESVANRDVSGVADRNIIQYVGEIKRLLPMKNQLESANGQLRAGCLELGENGGIAYFSDVERSLVRSFLRDPSGVYEAAISRFGIRR